MQTRPPVVTRFARVPTYIQSTLDQLRYSITFRKVYCVGHHFIPNLPSNCVPTAPPWSIKGSQVLVVLCVGKGKLKYVEAKPAMQCIASVDMLYFSVTNFDRPALNVSIPRDNVLAMYLGSTSYCVTRRKPSTEGPTNLRRGVLSTNHPPRQCHLDEVLHPALCRSHHQANPFPESSMTSRSKKQSVLSSWTLSSYLAIKTVSKVTLNTCFLSMLTQLPTHPCPWLLQLWLWCSQVVHQTGG